MRFVSMALVVVCALGGVAWAQNDAAQPAPETVQPEQAAAEDNGCDESRFEIYLRATFLNLDVETSMVRRMTLEKLDLADELGMDSETTPEIHLRWRFAEHHSLTASYLRIDESGEEFFALPLIVDGDLTGMFGRLESDLTLDYGRLGWRWEVAGRQTDRFSLETILDVAIFSVDGSYAHYDLLQPFIPTDEDDFDGTAGIPVIGLRVEGKPLDCLKVYGELAGMTAGKYGDMVDGELGLQVLLGKHFTVEAGYRFLSIHGEYDDSDDNDFADVFLGKKPLWTLALDDEEDEADIDLSGPFIGAGIRF